MSVTAFIACQRAEHHVPHAVACRALGVSQSWFYKWRERPPTPREERRARLDAAIGQVFSDSGGTYGSPRVTVELREAGWRVSVNTVASRMAALDLVAGVVRRRRGLTRQARRPAAPDLVNWTFTAQAPNRLWCGDLTAIPTNEGTLYLATVLDLFSRRSVAAHGRHNPRR